MTGIWYIATVLSTLPPAMEGAALRAVVAAIRTDNPQELYRAYKFAEAHARRERVCHLVGSSIPSTKGTTQAMLIDRLSTSREGAVPFVPLVVEVLLDLKSPNRQSAATCLGWIGPSASEATAALKHCLRLDNATPPPDRTPLPPGTQVTRILLSPEPEPVGDVPLRFSACVALWRIERRQETIIPVIMQGLSGGSPYEQMEALHAAAVIGTDIRGAVGPKLLSLGGSDNTNIRRYVYALTPAFAPDKETAATLLADALTRIADDAAALDKRVAEGTISLQDYAVAKQYPAGERSAAYTAIVATGRHAVEPLLPLLNNPRTKLTAIQIIGSLGRDGRLATNDLLRFAYDPNPAVRVQVRQTLEAITAD